MAEESKATTTIEVKPDPKGWKVFEGPGVEPVFSDIDRAIGYAETRACFRTGEIRVLDAAGAVQRVIPFDESVRRL
jgi:hypothetical protein